MNSSYVDFVREPWGARISDSTRSPILPMSWLEWTQLGDEYAGGRYRVRLVEAHKWEVLFDEQHVRYEARLSSALRSADDHHRERLRRLDLLVWSSVLIASTVLAGFTEYLGERSGGWFFVLLSLSLFGAVSAIVRLFAALSRNAGDPYRRRAPWERRRWRQRS